MSLQGKQAPTFTLIDSDKKPFDFASQKGKTTLLLFFPAAFTGVCTSELSTINNDLKRYSDANIDVVGISTDTPFALAEYKKVLALTFPLVSDHNAEVSALYGTKYAEGDFVLGLSRISRRAAFVVDADGNVTYEEVLEKASNIPNFEAINELLGV